jgi:hypothetical protein
MPIPKKETGETTSEFINRCMSDEKLIKEYPDTDQRYAVCIGQVETLRIVRKKLTNK